MAEPNDENLVVKKMRIGNSRNKWQLGVALRSYQCRSTPVARLSHLSTTSAPFTLTDVTEIQRVDWLLIRERSLDMRFDIFHDSGKVASGKAANPLDVFGFKRTWDHSFPAALLGFTSLGSTQQFRYL